MRPGRPVRVGRAGLAALFDFRDDDPEREQYDKQRQRLESAELIANAAAQGSIIPAITGDDD